MYFPDQNLDSMYYSQAFFSANAFAINSVFIKVEGFYKGTAY